MEFRFEFTTPDTQVMLRDGRVSLENDRGPIARYDVATTLFCGGKRLGTPDVFGDREEIRATSLTTRLLADPKRYLGHIDRGAPELTVFTRQDPYFDELAALYLIRHYLIEGAMPDIAGVFANYVQDSVHGRLSLDLVFPGSPASVILAINHRERTAGGTEYEINRRILSESFRFLEEVFALLPMLPNPWARNFLEGLQGFEDILHTIRADARAYTRDIQRSRIHSVPLVNRDTGIREEVDFVVTEHPESFLWKYWVRGDRENSPRRRGFAFSSSTVRTDKIGTDGNRLDYDEIVISVDPAAPYTLRGLGLLLEKLEVERLLGSGIELPRLLADPRPGAFRADPWYDGHNHDFTIVASPHAGSLLDRGTILESIFRYELWQYLGERYERYNDPDTLLSLVIPEPVNDGEIATALTPFRGASTDGAYADLNAIESVAWRIKTEAAEDGTRRRRRDERRERIVKALIDYNNRVVHPRAIGWRTQLCGLMVRGLPARHIQTFLLELRDIDSGNFDLLMERLIPRLADDRVAPFFLALEMRHPEVFSEWTRDIAAADEADSPILRSAARRLLIREFASRLELTRIRTQTREALPLYAFDRFKNHFDDLLIAADLTDGREIEAELKHFVAQDYLQLWENGDDKSFHGMMRSFFRFFRRRVHHRVFGEDQSHFHGLHSLILAQGNVELLGKYHRLSTEDFFNLDYEGIDDCYRSIQTRAAGKHTLRLFLDYLKLIRDIRAFESLFLRIGALFRLRAINRQPELREFFETNHPDLLEFQTFLVNFVDAAVIHPNISSPGEYVKRLKRARGALNNLKLLRNTSPHFDVLGILDDLYHFVSNILKGGEIPLKEMSQHLDLAFEQYRLITGPLLEKAEKLPGFYRELLLEALYSFKRYYQEFIDFFRDHLVRIVDTAGEEEFLANCNAILDHTVFFDWQEMKQLVDEQGDRRATEAFYRRYFAWRKLSESNEAERPEIRNQRDVLNARIRSAVPVVLDGKGALTRRLKKLPTPVEVPNYTEAFQFLAHRTDPAVLLNHFPLNLYLRSYEYLSDHFLRKFDIRSVSRSLRNFAMRFSWFYRGLTNTEVLRGMVLGTFSLLGLSSIIYADVTIPADTEDRGAAIVLDLSRALSHLLGDSLIGAVRIGLSAYWTTFFALLLLGPLCLLLVLQYRKYLASRLREQQRFISLFDRIESKKPSLLFIQFFTPLLLVLMETFKSNLVFINSMGLYNYVTTMVVLLLIINFSITRDILDANPSMPASWIFHRARHMFWLYFLQAMLVSIFLINILAHFPEFQEKNAVKAMRQGKVIAIDLPLISYKLYLLPKLTLLISTLSLFVSLFIKRVFQK